MKYIFFKTNSWFEVNNRVLPPEEVFAGSGDTVKTITTDMILNTKPGERNGRSVSMNPRHIITISQKTSTCGNYTFYSNYFKVKNVTEGIDYNIYKEMPIGERRLSVEELNALQVDIRPEVKSIPRNKKDVTLVLTNNNDTEICDVIIKISSDVSCLKINVIKRILEP